MRWFRRMSWRMVVSNIGITTDFSAIYTPNSAPHTAFVQVSLKEDHKVGSYEYMNRVRQRLNDEMPELSTYFQSGGLVDAVLNMGMPAPIDVQVSSSSLSRSYAVASQIAEKVRKLPAASDVLIPQDIDYPGSATRHRSRESQSGRAFAEGSRRQRHHRADFQRNDRAELLDRPEERQSLHADGAISRRCGQDNRRLEADSAAGRQE